jgi:hypothetical protein
MLFKIGLLSMTKAARVVGVFGVITLGIQIALGVQKVTVTLIKAIVVCVITIVMMATGLEVPGEVIICIVI